MKDAFHWHIYICCCLKYYSFFHWFENFVFVLSIDQRYSFFVVVVWSGSLEDGFLFWRPGPFENYYLSFAGPGPCRPWIPSRPLQTPAVVIFKIGLLDGARRPMLCDNKLTERQWQSSYSLAMVLSNSVKAGTSPWKSQTTSKIKLRCLDDFISLYFRISFKF